VADAIFCAMLRLAETTAIPPDPQIELVYGFSIWWNELRDVYPKSWWTIGMPGNDLMVEVHTPMGTLTSIECVSRGTVKSHDSALWTCTAVTEGHPIFEPTLTPWKKCPEPGLESFDFDFSPSEVKLHWGMAVRAVRSGRCMFGLDAKDDLVAVGLVGMTEREYGKLRLGVGESVRDVPVSQLQDWQLVALLDLAREQLDGVWSPGTEPAFVQLTAHATEIEREIERRRNLR
jgi:hypothetical protein